MLTKFIDMFKNKNIRERIVFTLGIFLIFKLGTAITLPLIDVNDYFSQFGETNMLSLLDMMGGGALSQFSIFAMGVSPYITSSIVIQLLASGVLPKLQELQEQGEKGKKALENTTRGLTLLLGGVQAYGILMTAHNAGMSFQGGVGVNDFWFCAYIITLLMAGTFFVMWLGDQITQKGVGNGVSMLIFAGIIASIPTHFISAFDFFIKQDTSTATKIFAGVLNFSLYTVIYLILIIFVIFMEKAQRKIPIQYSNSSYSVRSASDVTFLPIKLNSAGVIPIIFASSVMAAPATLIALVGKDATENSVVKFLSLTSPFHGWYTGLMVFAFLNILFTFFYANMQVDATKMSENFSKSGAYIPGIRPGKETATYISRVLNRITVVGALFITSIALVPYLMQIFITKFIATASTAQTLASGFGGTGIIIVVGVALETVKEIEGRMAGKDYSGFAESGN